MRLAPGRARRRLHRRRGAHGGQWRERPQRGLPRGRRRAGASGRGASCSGTRSRSASTARRSPPSSASTRSPTRSAPRTTSRTWAACASPGSRTSSSTRASSTRRCAPTTFRPSGSTRPICPRSCGGRVASASSRRPTPRCIRRAGCAPSRARSRRAACASSSAAPCPSRSRPPRNGGFAVRAGGGTVHAQRVVVAADGALPQLVPYYAPSVRTKRLHMVATAPLAERVVPCAIGARWGYEYLQQRPDGRIAVGGFSDRDGERAADSYTTREEPSPAIHARIERLPARRPRHRRADHAPLGRAGRATRATSARSSAPCPGTTASSSRAATTAPAISTASRPGASSRELLATGASADAHLYDSARPLVTA